MRVTEAGARALRPAAVQAALVSCTETLAAELARPSRDPPDWSALEWRIARAAAAMHGVSPLLARRSGWRAPAPWLEFLEQQRVHTEIRHGRVIQLLRCLDAMLRASGIAAVAPTSAALHALGLYAAGERPMADVDLLVAPQDAQKTARMLEAMGYAEVSRGWKERVFKPGGGGMTAALGEHADNPIKIELHERICEKLPWRVTDISPLIWSAAPRPGLNPYPSTAALLLHLLLHAAGAYVFQGLRLLHLHDVSRVCLRMEDADWDAFLAYRGRGRTLWWAVPPLLLTARYGFLGAPPRVLEPLIRDCPLLLRRTARRKTLTDVSYSHLWIDPFPGIEWSESVPLAWAYVKSRLRPIRWATSRPARPVTLHAVQAVLTQP